MRLALVLHKYGIRLDDPCCFPLGFMYVSSLLKQQGHDVTIYNLNLWDEYPDDLSNFDAVLMTGFEEFESRIKALAMECKIKGVRSILGGALATFKTQEMASVVDTVIVGECENVLGEALTTKGVIKGTKTDLGKVPLPDYDGFNVSEYHRRNGVRHVGVLTSRGCPYSCRFCAHTCFYQERDLNHVFDEILLYTSKYKAECIVFNDNTLNVRKNRFMAICHFMKAIKIPWTAAIRADRLDEEMVIAAKNSNAKHFVVGVESLNQKKLDRLNKCTTTGKILKCLELLTKHKVNYHGNILVGLDGESVDDVIMEVSLIPRAYNLLPAMIQPYIGGELSNKRSFGINEENELNQLFAEIINRKGMCYNI